MAHCAKKNYVEIPRKKKEPKQGNVLGLYSNEDDSSWCWIFVSLVVANLYTTEQNFEGIGQLCGQFLVVYFRAAWKRGNSIERESSIALHYCHSTPVSDDVRVDIRDDVRDGVRHHIRDDVRDDLKWPRDVATDA